MKNKIINDFIYNIIGVVLPVIVLLLTTPLYIRTIGVERYGALTTILLFIGYFGFFDFGLSRATAQKMSFYVSTNNSKSHEIFWTALTLTVIISLIGGILIVLTSALFFEFLIPYSNPLYHELSHILPWLVFAIPLITVSGVINGAFQAYERFREINILSTVGALLTQVIPLMVGLLHGPSLVWIIPSVVISRLVMTILACILCKKTVLRNSIYSFSKFCAIDLVAFGSWVSVSLIIGPIIMSMDRFMIALLVGPEAVTYYSIPFMVGEKTTTFPLAILSLLFPKFAMLNTSNSKQLLEDTVKIIAGIFSFLMIIIILNSKLFFSIWMGIDFSQQVYSLASLTFFGFWVNAIGMIPYTYLQARSKAEIVAKCHLAEFIPYTLLLIVCLLLIGVKGAVFAFITRVAVDCVFQLYFSGILIDTYRIIAGSAGLIVCSILIILIFDESDWMYSVLSFLLLILSAIWAWIIVPSSYRSEIYQFITGIFRAKFFKQG